jgi:hypothetical protein
MTDRYLRSTDGSNSDTGATWALAKATLAGVISTPLVAGETCYVSQVHTEVSASSLTYTLPGTLASPTRIICGNDGAEPPTAVAAAAAISTTGASSISINGSGLIQGIVFTCGNGANAANFSILGLSAAVQRYDSCDFIHADTHTSAVMIFGLSLADASSRLTFKDCRFKQPATNGNAISLRGPVHINGGSFISGTLTPTVGIFAVGTQSRDSDFLCENFDFSNCAADSKLFKTPVASNAYGLIRNCKLPASWTGTLITSAIAQAGYTVEMRNCSSGATVYRLWHESYPGTIRDDANAVKASGAADAVGGYSLKMTTLAGASEINPLRLLELQFDNTSVGVSKTATVELIHDSATALTDAEIWGEVHSLNTSGSAQGTMVSCQRASPLTTAANQTSSAVSWSGSVVSGMSNANKQKLVVTFTPQVAGRYVFKVFLGKASKTVYVDGAVTVA